MSTPPAVLALLDAAAHRERPEDRESFWALREPFEAFIAALDVVDLLASKLDRLLEQPGDTLNLAAGLNWRIGSAGRVTLFLRAVLPAYYDPEDAPSDRFWAAADGRPLPLRRYRAVIPGDPRILDGGVHLEELDRYELAVGDALAIQARTDIVVPVVDRERLVWELAAPPVYHERWIYDPETLAPAFAMTASRALTQLDYILGLLRDLGDAQAVPALERYATEHAAHFVRYRAVEALCAIAPDRAEMYLRRLLDDPHPHLRDVARQALGVS